MDCSDRSNKPKSCSKLCAVSALLTDRKSQPKYQRGGIPIGLQLSLHFQPLLPSLLRHVTLGIQGHLQRKEDREVTLKGGKRAEMATFSSALKQRRSATRLEKEPRWQLFPHLYLSDLESLANMRRFFPDMAHPLNPSFLILHRHQVLYRHQNEKKKDEDGNVLGVHNGG